LQQLHQHLKSAASLFSDVIEVALLGAGSGKRA
jgi:hypothetical protein